MLIVGRDIHALNSLKQSLHGSFDVTVLGDANHKKSCNKCSKTEAACSEMNLTLVPNVGSGGHWQNRVVATVEHSMEQDTL